MDTRTERDRRAASQRARRMAARACGHCGSPAELMITWGDGQNLAICQSCRARLDAPVLLSPFCSFDEVNPATLRSAARSGAMQEQTGRPEGEKGTGLFGKVWTWLMKC